jgi:hypothetical protein
MPVILILAQDEYVVQFPCSSRKLTFTLVCFKGNPVVGPLTLPEPQPMTFRVCSLTQYHLLLSLLYQTAKGLGKYCREGSTGVTT